MAHLARLLHLGRWTLLPLSALLAAVSALALLRRVGVWLPLFAGGALALAWLTWVLGSTLSPALPPDRRCPRCKRPGLAPLRRGSALGVRCRECGFSDASAHIPNLGG